MQSRFACRAVQSNEQPLACCCAAGTLAQATNAICGGPDRVEGKLSFLRTSWLGACIRTS
jgi:hypothetical protein